MKTKRTDLMKRIAVFFTALALVFTMLQVTESTASAANATVKLNKTSVTLEKGSKVTLKVKNCPSKATVTWASSDKKIATVTAKGVVKAVKKGNAVVKCTVKTKAGKKTVLKCKVTVKNVSADTPDTEDTTVTTRTTYLSYSSTYGDVIDGRLTWDTANHTWEATYPTAYGKAIVKGTYTDDGTMTGVEDNMTGYALAEVPLIQEKFVEFLAGNFYCPLILQSSDASVKSSVGTLSWNEKDMTWSAQYPTNYGTVIVSGTYDSNGVLTALKDNIGGYAIADVGAIQPTFTNALKGEFSSEAEEETTTNALAKEIAALTTDNKWQNVIVDRAKEYDPEVRNGDTIFYGASNFNYWESMEEDLAPYSVENHAFGGSTDADLLYWAPYMLYNYNPTCIFFQTGSNDYIESTAATDELKVEEAMNFKKKMFAEIHEHLPNAKLVVMSGILLPGRTEYVDMTLMINDQLKAYCATQDYLVYVDAESLTYDRSTHSFVDNVDSLFVEDGIHLTDAARITWAQKWILPTMEELNCVKSK